MAATPLVRPARPAGWPPGSLLAGLPVPAREALAHSGTGVRFVDGDALVTEGAAAVEAFLLLAGRVKVSLADPPGPPLLVAIRTAGDLVGELAVFDDGPRSATVRACGAVSARRIGRRDLLTLLDRDRAVRHAVQRSLSAKVRASTRARVGTGTASAEVRTARVLLDLAERHGVREVTGVRIAVPLTQAEIASLAATADCTVHRVLRMLRDAGVVATGYRRVTVTDPVRLRALAGRGPVG